MAYGYLSLKPNEFFNLQIHEFYTILDGRREAERHEDERKAYFVSWLVNTQVKNPVSPIDILSPLYPEVKEEAEEARQEKRKEDEAYLKKAFGLK